MARRFATSIDLTGFALLGALLNPVSSDPAGLGVGDAGRVWFNTTTGKLMVWNGTTAIDFLARSSHTGTQLASTISDLASTVKGYRLDEFAAPTGPVSFGGQRNSNVADPTGAQDSATKNYVDTALAGLASGQTLKGSVRVAATTNVSLTTPGATIDGVTMTSGDVVLLTGQSTASQNGPYVWSGASSALVRAANWDTTAEAVLGSYWIVREGSQADTFALLTNDTTVTLGTTALAFVFRGAAGASYTAGDGLSLTGTVFSVNPASGGGIAVGPGGVSLDTTAARVKGGTVPASTSGIFSISGATVTVNHGIGRRGVIVGLRAGTSPASGYTAGQVVEVDTVESDANNVVVTLPVAPAANAWIITVVG